MIQELIQFILVILLFFPLWTIIRNSSLVKNKKYKYILTGFITIHLLGLFLSSSSLGKVLILTGRLSVYLSIIGLIITHSIWLFRKKNKTILDFLKLTWTVVFTCTYVISWNYFQFYSSWTVGHYFVGIFPPIGPDYLTYLHITHFSLLVFIAILQYRNQKFSKTNST